MAVGATITTKKQAYIAKPVSRGTFLDERIWKGDIWHKKKTLFLFKSI